MNVLSRLAQAAWMIPAPSWLIAADLACAYFPLAWLGHWLARPRR